MSQVNVIDSGDHLVLDLSITRPGKLGIEFQQTASPYVVVRVSEEAQQLSRLVPLLLQLLFNMCSRESKYWLPSLEIGKERFAIENFDF